MQKTTKNTENTAELWQAAEKPLANIAAELYEYRRTPTEAREQTERVAGRPARLPMVFN